MCVRANATDSSHATKQREGEREAGRQGGREGETAGGKEKKEKLDEGDCE